MRNPLPLIVIASLVLFTLVFAAFYGAQAGTSLVAMTIFAGLVALAFEAYAFTRPIDKEKEDRLVAAALMAVLERNKAKLWVHDKDNMDTNIYLTIEDRTYLLQEDSKEPLIRLK